MHDWHERRRLSAIELGYGLSVMNMTDYHPYTIFPKLDRLWRKRDPTLLKFYEVLGRAIEDCDVFIHFNGVLVHPEFLEQFNQLKIYHCADDPDASEVVSRPVAASYDICAISNPSCIETYKSWGCKNTFFWPLGSFSYLGQADYDTLLPANGERDVPLIFIGSKFGSTNLRYIGKYLKLFKKKRFMETIEKTFPELVAYGGGWPRGRLADELIRTLYRKSRVGFNVHNSLGPINGRLFDLAAFGVCQICDNKSRLSMVFEEGKEIIGFEKLAECIDLIRYYLEHEDEAEAIGVAGRQRFLKDYTESAIWIRFFENINRIIHEHA
jgi:Glycosyl transferases group 1